MTTTTRSRSEAPSRAMTGQWPIELKHLHGPGAKAPGPSDLKHLILFCDELKRLRGSVSRSTMMECLRRMARHLKDRKRSIEEKREMFGDYERLLGKFSTGAWIMGTDDLIMALEWFPAIGQLNAQLTEAEKRLETRHQIVERLIESASRPSSGSVSGHCDVPQTSLKPRILASPTLTHSSTEAPSSGFSVVAASIRRMSAG